MSHSKNQILARASRVDLEDLGRNMRVVDLKHGQVVADTRQRVPYVYFPHGGILSAIVELESGWAIETGMIGKDGVFGAAQAIDGKLSLNKVMVQVPDQASVVDAEHLKAVQNPRRSFSRFWSSTKHSSWPKYSRQPPATRYTA
jgi:hypothetical protein